MQCEEQTDDTVKSYTPAAMSGKDNLHNVPMDSWFLLVPEENNDYVQASLDSDAKVDIKVEGDEFQEDDGFILNDTQSDSE